MYNEKKMLSPPKGRGFRSTSGIKMTEQEIIKKNRQRLLLIVAFFFVPLVIATIWYKNLPAGFSPSKTTNNGELIRPAVPIQPFSQATLAGDTLSGKNLETVWTLVHLLDSPCEEACSKALYNTRQIRIALNKDIDRVKRIAVVSEAVEKNTDRKMWASHPDLKLARAATAGLGAQIRGVVGEGVEPHSVYLIDPLGNLMMRFPPDLNPKLMMKDLRKLLKLSRVG